jgi:hypothetical protein
MSDDEGPVDSGSTFNISKSTELVAGGDDEKSGGRNMSASKLQPDVQRNRNKNLLVC